MPACAKVPFGWFERPHEPVPPSPGTRPNPSKCPRSPSSRARPRTIKWSCRSAGCVVRRFQPCGRSLRRAREGAACARRGPPPRPARSLCRCEPGRTAHRGERRRRCRATARAAIRVLRFGSGAGMERTGTVPERAPVIQSTPSPSPRPSVAAGTRAYRTKHGTRCPTSVRREARQALRPAWPRAPEPSVTGACSPTPSPRRSPDRFLRARVGIGMPKAMVATMTTPGSVMKRFWCSSRTSVSMPA